MEAITPEGRCPYCKDDMLAQPVMWRAYAWGFGALRKTEHGFELVAYEPAEDEAISAWYCGRCKKQVIVPFGTPVRSEERVPFDDSDTQREVERFWRDLEHDAVYYGEAR